ncbi:MAG TPA: YihY/virulence factor BrkB family protein [Acidimicrobiales bacterium]|nr:YihY/virulence factor BrkB family protein [Acidimicrobiales bacterium]
MKERLEAMPVIGAALRIQERVGEIKGNQLATSIAFGMFLSLFPLLLAIIATVGFLAGSNPDFTDDLIDNLGLTGAAADAFRDVIANAEDSKRTASIIGVAGLLWSGLSLVGTLALVINTSWQVKGRGLVDKLSGIVWLLGGGVLLVASLGLSSLLDDLPGLLTPLDVLLGLALGFGLFLWTFWFLGAAKPPVRSLMPGALLCAAGFEVLKVLGAVVVPRIVASSSALYGSLGVVFAIIAWLVFFGRLIVYGTVLNVVRHEAAHGTARVTIDVPVLAGMGAPTEADRSGTVVDRDEPVVEREDPE